VAMRIGILPKAKAAIYCSIDYEELKRKKAAIRAT
jgi:hypothetical protein